MSGNKLYVARFSDKRIEYFDNWLDCEKKVKGQSNVAFKGFKSRDEANEWLSKFQSHNSPKPTNTEQIRIYVDGSFNPQFKEAGWGWVAVQNDNILAEGWGKTKLPAESRNIDGELEAAIRAIEWAKKELKHNVYLYYDYAGIAQWALGLWKSKTPVAQNYIQKIKELNYPVHFEKVKGHSGDKWNDYVDELAKKGFTS